MQRFGDVMRKNVSSGIDWVLSQRHGKRGVLAKLPVRP